MKKINVLKFGMICLSFLFAVSCGSGKKYAKGLEMINVPGGEYESPNYAWLFEMAYLGVNNRSSDDMKNVVVPNFQIAKTETTYETWYDVLKWATDEARGDKRYRFVNVGKEGIAEAEGTVPGANKSHPVTTIGWETAIVWCNALSEKAKLEPVYYFEGNVLRDEKKLNEYKVFDGTWDGNKAARSTVVGLRGNLTYETAVDAAAKVLPLCSKLSIDETKNGFRLPNVYEWVYAARGGKPGSFDWDLNYSGSDGANEVGWFKEECGWDSSLKIMNEYLPNYGTKPVAQKKKNILGLCDMSGNVAEWTNSFCYRFDADAIAGSVALSAYVAGGDWTCSSKANYSKISLTTTEMGEFTTKNRSSVTFPDHMRYKDNTRGFRVARTLSEK